MADPLVAVIMGSTSDLETMQNAVDVLDQFDIPNEIAIVPHDEFFAGALPGFAVETEFITTE